MQHQDSVRTKDQSPLTFVFSRFRWAALAVGLLLLGPVPLMQAAPANVAGAGVLSPRLATQPSAAEGGHAAMTFGSYFGAEGGQRQEFDALALSPDGSVVVVGTRRAKHKDRLDAQGDMFVMKISDAGETLWDRSFDCGDAEEGDAVDVDAAGNIYALGSVYECDFPTTAGAYQESGECAGALVKLTPDGDVIYSTLVMQSSPGICGGSAADVAAGDAGSAVVVGVAQEGACAQRGATNLGGSASQVHLLELSPDGSTATTNLCFGGSENDNAWAVDASHEGLAYVVGGTRSTDFPTRANAYQAAPGGTTDAFVSAVDTATDEIRYSTYLGGRDIDFATDVDVTAAGVFVAGRTESKDHPGAESSSVGGAPEAYLTSLSADLSQLAEVKIIPAAKTGHFINSIDAIGGRLHFAGVTQEEDLDIVGQFQTVYRGGTDIFFGIHDFDSGVTEVLSYLGGPGRERASGIAVLPDGDFYVGGASSSRALPVANPTQKRARSSVDAYLATFTITSTACDLLGGPGNDRLFGTDENDVMCGFGGDDVLRGRAGADQIWGHSGDDFLGGGKGADVLRGGSGSDELFGNRGPDRLFGNRGHDVLRGGPGRDRLYGGRGNDDCDAGGWRADREQGC